MADYFDPKIVSRVRGFEIRSMRLVESYMVGMHKSAFRGISTEFAQHRQYVIGDDTRHIDWKVFAKTDEVFVKEYEAETNMAVVFLLDVSPSMFYKSEDTAMSKYEYAATVAATLSYMLMSQKDTFGMTLFSDKIEYHMPTKGSGLHFRNIIDVLNKVQNESLESEGEKKEDKGTDIGNVVRKIAPQIKSKGVVVILSDFINDLETLGVGLGQIHSLGQDCMLFHLEDPVERDFPFYGQTILKGLENEGKLLCDPRDLRNIYLREKAKHMDSIQDLCMKFGFDIRSFTTEDHIDSLLTEFLSTRMAQRRRGR